MDDQTDRAAIPKAVVIGATYRKAQSAATRLHSTRGETKRGMSDRPRTAWHDHKAACRRRSRWIRPSETGGQRSDDSGAAAFLSSLACADRVWAVAGADVTDPKDRRRIKG